MEYVPGISLKKYMKQQQKLFSEQETLTLMQPILLALQAMHQKGILHRDISPENLMLSPNNTLTLIDFGAARTFSRSDDDNLTVILKRGYAPEEQYHSNSRQGPWTDLYAVCAVMYQMLTGILPQEASGPCRRRPSDTDQPYRRTVPQPFHLFCPGKRPADGPDGEISGYRSTDESALSGEKGSGSRNNR